VQGLTGSCRTEEEENALNRTMMRQLLPLSHYMLSMNETQCEGSQADAGEGAEEHYVCSGAKRQWRC
jgi:hypothetical protein